MKAPFAGVVVRVDRRIGDFVDGTAATPVVEIAATDGWEIVASASSVVAPATAVRADRVDRRPDRIG